MLCRSLYPCYCYYNVKLAHLQLSTRLIIRRAGSGSKQGDNFLLCGTGLQLSNDHALHCPHPFEGKEVAILLLYSIKVQ